MDGFKLAKRAVMCAYTYTKVKVSNLNRISMGLLNSYRVSFLSKLKKADIAVSENF